MLPLIVLLLWRISRLSSRRTIHDLVHSIDSGNTLITDSFCSNDNMLSPPSPSTSGRTTQSRVPRPALESIQSSADFLAEVAKPNEPTLLPRPATNSPRAPKSFKACSARPHTKAKQASSCKEAGAQSWISHSSTEVNHEEDGCADRRGRGGRGSCLHD